MLTLPSIGTNILKGSVPRRWPHVTSQQHYLLLNLYNLNNHLGYCTEVAQEEAVR